HGSAQRQKGQGCQTGGQHLISDISPKKSSLLFASSFFLHNLKAGPDLPAPLWGFLVQFFSLRPACSTIRMPSRASSSQTALPVTRFMRLRAAGVEVSKAASMAVCRDSMDTSDAAK